MMDRIRVIERRDVDELVILDIAATPEGRGPRFDEIARFCENLFCPVTVGGGVRNCNDIARLLRSGADKVSINTAAYERPDLIDEAAQKFGSQAIVVSIDVRQGTVHTHCGRRDRFHHPVQWAQDCEARGAGEILLNAVERDGSLAGYDLDLVRAVCGSVAIPVVVSGGAGSYRDMAAGFSAGAHAVAAGAMFQFTEQTPKGAARFLDGQGYAVRV